jgi:hypothetical protein
MSYFNKLIDEILMEMGNTAAGSFGPAATGNYGNQFPSQNDMAYAPGTAVTPTILGAKKLKGRKRGKRSKTPMQRRNLKNTM